MIMPYLSDMINDHKTPMNLRVHSRDEVINYETQFGEWKIQLIMAINFISFKDSTETRTMHTKSDNIKAMMDSKTYDIVDELFESFLRNYQERLEESMRGSECLFDSVDLLHYHPQRVSLKRSREHIDSPKWLFDKKATINTKSRNNHCFKHSLVAAEHWENIDNHPERISNLKGFFRNCNCKDIDFPATSKDWKKFEQNKKTIALNILFVPHNTEKIELPYKSKYNLKPKNELILLMITGGEKWHYLAVKNLPELLKGITSNHNGGFYSLIFFSFIQHKK